MVNEIVQLSEIASAPGLEQETIQEINLTIRHKLKQYRDSPVDDSPADIISNPELFREWIHGAGGGS